MDKLLGRIVEVYIPEEYKNNELIDVMASVNIGFKVILEETKEIIDIVVEQNEYNCDIYREDMVVVIKDKDTNKFTSIEIYNGDVYE